MVQQCAPSGIAVHRELSCAWRCSCQNIRHGRLGVAATHVVTATSGSPSSIDEDAKPLLRIVPLPPPSDTMYTEGQFVEVGTVAGAFGIKGEVRVDVSTDNPKKRFGLPGKRIFLRPPPASGLLAKMQGAQEQGMLEMTTASAKYQTLPKGGQAWIVQFSQLSDRSQALQLLNYGLYIPVADREKLKDPDEFWVQDLVGCRAFLKDSSQYVGRVLDVISGTGTHDTLILQLVLNKDDIRNSRTRQCMIPFAKAICPVIDYKLKQLVIDPPEGLLDLFTYKPMQSKLTEEKQAERLLILSRTPMPVLGQAYNPASTAPQAAVPQPPAAGLTPAPVKLSARRRQAELIAERDRAAVEAGSAPQFKQPWAPPTNDIPGPEGDVLSKSNAGGAALQGQIQQQQPGETRGTPSTNVPSHPVDVDSWSSSSGDDSEEEEEEEEVAEAAGDGKESTGIMTATDKWKLRRKLGVSLASKLRRPGSVKRPQRP